MTLDPYLGRAYVHMAQIMEVHGRLSEALWYYQRARSWSRTGRSEPAAGPSNGWGRLAITDLLRRAVPWVALGR
jgi:hypothetical protein